VATTRLQLYNNALRHCGERRLASITEEREPRRLLDDVWDDGWVDTVLEAGLWKFAMRTQRLDFETSVTPPFGYARAFLKPEDWIRPNAVCTDEYFNEPLLRYQDEGDYIYSDLDEIFVRFVSNHSTRGGDLSIWTGAFADYAAAYGASKIIYKLTADKDRILLLMKPRTGILPQSLQTARSLDAMNENTRFPPAGTWVRSRGRMGGGPMGDGGQTGSLIG
jgi:hypothetical protein